MKQRHHVRAFTLIEVLVALAIVAFGLTALFTATNQTVRTSSYLREKSLAQWIALNRISEIRLSGQVPADKKTGGDIDYANQSWRWELEVIQTPVEGIVRLEARVAPSGGAKNSWSGLATGFMGAAIAPPGGPDLDWLGSATAAPPTRSPNTPGDQTPAPTPAPEPTPEQPGAPTK